LYLFIKLFKLGAFRGDDKLSWGVSGLKEILFSVCIVGRFHSATYSL